MENGELNSTQNPKGGVWKYDEVVLVLVDYQPQMFQGVHSETPPKLIELNVRFLIKVAKDFGIPVILSSVSVKAGVNGPTVSGIANEMPDFKIIDRVTMNAWEDENLKAAVKATGKKRIVIAGLYTEICVVYPVISAIQDGYETMFIADAIGGQSQIAHQMGISRMIQAGAVPSTTRATIDEWFRNWETPQGESYHPLLRWHKEELNKLYPNLQTVND